MHRADVHLGQPEPVDALLLEDRVDPSLSSAAAFSVNVNATTFRGSTPGSDRIDAIRWEMTWVFPEPAQAMIWSGSSRQAIASAWAGV